MVIIIFLKKIRLKGFKSFANKTDIEIEENITAVVGPNGSGKSNIVDAIRWVLGEQSAKNLRGSRMADIIFAGSENLNAKHSASVTLFFNNENGALPIDGKELTLGRQVDADGRSDYLINGASCRLKDIEMLLMDSGLGSDGYAIVGQGRIDSIIKSKPEKMRLFFEEAAGIMKHKSRKEEAEKRLANTSNDLNRIHDLVDELEKRYQPLARAAQKAEQYREYKADLADLEISLLHKQWQDYSAAYKKVKAEKDQAEKLLQKKESEFNSLNYQLDNKKDKLKLLKNKKEEVSNDFFQSRNKLNEIDNNLNVMAERKKNYLQQEAKLEEQNKVLKKEKSSSEEDLKEIKKEYKIVSSDNDEIAAEISKLEQQIKLSKENLANKKQELNQQEETIKQLENKIQSEDAFIQRLQERVAITKERLAEMSADKSDLNLKQKNKNSELDKVTAEINKLKDLLAQKETMLTQKDEALSKERQKLESGKEDLITLKEDFQHCSSRLQLMEEMQDSYEGYYNGVRNILEKKEKFPGLIDVVAEIVNVDSDYETAIETALGAKMQNIIVETDQTARQAVKYLKNNHLGRATFLPLNMVNGSRLADHYLANLNSEAGFIGLAVDLVDFPVRLENIFNFLLGQIVVTDNLNHAVKIAKKSSKNFRIVTTEGDVVYPGGAISGGSSASNSRDLIGRSRKIDELQANKADLKEQGQQLVVKLEKKQAEVTKLQQDKEQIKVEIQSLKIEENNLLNSKNRLVDLLKELESEQNSSQTSLKNLNSDLQNNQTTIKTKQTDIDNYQQKIAELTVKKQQLQREINSSEESLLELEPDLKELELTAARISEKRINIEEKVKAQQSDLKSKQEAIQANITQIKQFTADLKKLAVRKEQLQLKKEDLSQKSAELKKEQQKLTAEITELEKLVEVEEKSAKKLQQELNQLKDNFHQFDLKYNDLESKLSNIKDILTEDYQLTPAEINPAEIKEIKKADEAAVEEKIKQLKTKMNKLHPVNEAAVEEFAELKERLDFLHEQQADLQHARDSIKLVISDIEESMEKMFSQTFYQVKTEFTKVFKALFQGGKAELKLSEPEEMLTTGVEIHAQPPGKSLKSLSLLSGGERALTAIALIFAFIQVKPSPFYVLDEIDAPLDDVNIARFASFIKKYARVSQFIIITHRRYMMTEVDSLYGVTMEKSGVSKLVSLKLDQAEEMNENFIKEAL
ncbi:chromosome segregation protein SMC [Halanaerobium salsuginis]|uniref:Chromosome partition protein Smc n=1 Tax=Halanaerobium salsuginis TaxID=29563 RepID=A0A1I4FBG0_9FIRM|nr:chromosome segregation protein SMC [Halanaerobium salsuginis]SFL15342.1 condensin subunit Smc [Halanaerobium salsuginis]